MRQGYDPTCIFCRIVVAEVPASVVYRDERAIAFIDIHPVNPGHLLVAPLAHAADLGALPEETGGHLFAVAQRLAIALRASGVSSEGVNLFLADGKAAGQEVFHVHLHVIPRFSGDGISLAAFGRLPATVPSREELEATAAGIRSALQRPGR
ncbi:MAG: HIT family protein [Anaerolineales bacterium]